MIIFQGAVGAGMLPDDEHSGRCEQAPKTLQANQGIDLDEFWQGCLID